MRISDWSSDVCSSDLFARRLQIRREKASLRKEAFPDSAGDQLDTTKQSVPGLFLFRTAHGEWWLCFQGQDIISRLHVRPRIAGAVIASTFIMKVAAR